MIVAFEIVQLSTVGVSVTSLIFWPANTLPIQTRASTPTSRFAVIWVSYKAIRLVSSLKLSRQPRGPLSYIQIADPRPQFNLFYMISMTLFSIEMFRTTVIRSFFPTAVRVTVRAANIVTVKAVPTGAISLVPGLPDDAIRLPTRTFLVSTLILRLPVSSLANLCFSATSTHPMSPKLLLKPWPYTIAIPFYTRLAATARFSIWGSASFVLWTADIMALEAFPTSAKESPVLPNDAVRVIQTTQFPISWLLVRVVADI